MMLPWCDFQHTIRTLRKNPGFTAIAVLSLALGIGANTAVFSLVNAILLSSLPVPNPQELRELRWSGTEVRIPSISGDSAFSPPVFQLLREQGANLADIFGYVPLQDVIIKADREAFTASGAMVSDNFLSGLGVRPLIGRLLTAGEDFAGRGTYAAISYDWWERHFSLDPNVIGRTIRLNGKGFTVVGVLPRGFVGVDRGHPSDFYVPMSNDSQFLYVAITSRFHWYVRVMARMKPGADDERLRAILNVTFVRETRQEMKSSRILVQPGQGGTAYDREFYHRPLLLMLGVVGLVLLVACANLAGLLLARGAAQQHEWAVRAALGAGYRRLISRALVESLLLALLGGLLGILIAFWGRTVIARLLGGSAGHLRYDLSLDWLVLSFTLISVLITALLSGLLPALRAGRTDPVTGLGSRGTLGAPRLRIGRFLVIAQIGLSLVLLTGAGLYVRTLINLADIDPGFRMEKLLLFQLHLRGSGYADGQPSEFYSRVQNSLVAIPGVQSASFIEFPLLGDGGSTGDLRFMGRPTAPGMNMQTRRYTVGESFFSTFGIPILQGRGFSENDGEGALKVIVVNESFVRKYLPGENPLGLTIRMWEAEWQIVGVCRDVKYALLREPVPPTTYFPFRQRLYSRFRQTHLRNGHFALRTFLPPSSLITAVRKAIAEIDAGVPIDNITTQEEVRDRGISRERLFAALCGTLATLAVLLSCIGLYGLMAYHVARRRKEIGIRMALGATGGRIAGPILREALLLAGAGLIVGIPIAIFLADLIKSQLFGLAPLDPNSFFGSAILLLAVTLLAAWFPARRATRIHPIVALRAE